MAKEISTLTISGIFNFPSSAPYLTRKFGASSTTEDVADKNYSSGTQNIGTTDETLPLDDIATPKRVWIKNNGATAVLVGADGTNYPISIAPLSQAYFGFNGAAVHCKSVTTANDIEFFIGGV